MPVLKVLALRDVLKAAAFDDEAIASALANGLGTNGYWRFCTPIADDADDLEGTKFLKSIRKYVNDDEKRANFLAMLTAIYRAAAQSDYAAVLSGSVVDCKPAHKFNYHGSNRTVLELKQGKKDRIYFFSEHFSGFPCIVLMLAHHKKDQTTPREVTNHCESTMKACLGPSCKIVIK